MGIIDWFFGRKAHSEQAQKFSSAAGYDFRNGERPPDRKWRWHMNDVGGQKVALGVAGIDYRIDEVIKFLTAAQHAEQSDGRYGVLLDREPHNLHDSNAIRVAGWIDDPSNAIQLGYLFREDAAQIAKEFPNGTPITAMLWRVYVNHSSKLWVGVRLLIPAKRDPCWLDHKKCCSSVSSD